MELNKLLRDAGIVGAGGAGFPSYAKLNEGANTLLVNGSECEPLLYTDYVLLKNEMTELLSGIRILLDNTNLRRAVLAIKRHTAERLALADGEVLSRDVTIKVLPDVYPIGDEISLIYQTLGRVVTPGQLPISVGVIVYNVETLINISRAAHRGEGVTYKWLTVGGAVKEPAVVCVPIGAPVSKLFSYLGIEVPEGYSIVEGGPSMGKLVSLSRATVTKTTKGLLVLPDTSRAVESKRINERMATARAETACCQCTRCTDMCPRNLLGYPLEPHKMVRTAMGAAVVSPVMVLSATLCCGCGICENLACSQGISPKAVIQNYKALLAKHKMRYTANAPVEPAPERDYRMIPTDRWAYTLGVKQYDVLPREHGVISFETVRIPLSRHIGVPAVPVVKDGDIVREGDLIARAADGLSVSYHASISGTVTVGENEIIIHKVN